MRTGVRDTLVPDSVPIPEFYIFFRYPSRTLKISRTSISFVIRIGLNRVGMIRIKCLSLVRYVTLRCYPETYFRTNVKTSCLRC